MSFRITNWNKFPFVILKFFVCHCFYRNVGLEDRKIGFFGQEAAQNLILKMN